MADKERFKQCNVEFAISDADSTMRITQATSWKSPHTYTAPGGGTFREATVPIADAEIEFSSDLHAELPGHTVSLNNGLPMVFKLSNVDIRIYWDSDEASPLIAINNAEE